MSDPGERFSDDDVDRVARDFIMRYRLKASVKAIERIITCIDTRDWDGRDTWARVVRRIHQLEASKNLAVLAGL